MPQLPATSHQLPHRTSTPTMPLMLKCRAPYAAPTRTALLPPFTPTHTSCPALSAQ